MRSHNRRPAPNRHSLPSFNSRDFLAKSARRVLFLLYTSRPEALHNAVVILGYGITLIIAYLLGSIPTGFLLAKARGIDIRTVGSGNIGATNVFRYLGKPAGIFVLLVDALKGWVAVAVVAKLILLWWFPNSSPTFHDAIRVCAGLAAILGHNYTCWLHFKGGKGIATSAGVLIALVPKALLIILAVWLVIFLLTRYVSLGSICGSATLPFAQWFTSHNPIMTGVTTAMAALAIYKHRANIKRLLNGTENRISFKKRPPAEPPTENK
jgi:glycerol-3-phosphate acyltransferase PlsY